MPRHGRIEIVGKFEARESWARADEMYRLAGTLRWEWRQYRAAQRAEDVAGEPSEPDQLGAVQ
jgi:hypothetical protein